MAPHKRDERAARTLRGSRVTHTYSASHLPPSSIPCFYSFSFLVRIVCVCVLFFCLTPPSKNRQPAAPI